MNLWRHDKVNSKYFGAGSMILLLSTTGWNDRDEHHIITLYRVATPRAIVWGSEQDDIAHDAASICVDSWLSGCNLRVQMNLVSRQCPAPQVHATLLTPLWPL